MKTVQQANTILASKVKTRIALAGPLFLLAAGSLLDVSLTAQTADAQQTTASTQNKAAPKELIESGRTLFQQQCGFCHGRDAGGGETGPSLVDSELVKRDKAGTEVAAVIRNGRPEKGMPKFDLSGSAMDGVVAFISNQQAGDASNGKRRGVLPADLQTGNAEAGKQYFNGAGKCSSCHSPTGDLAGIAKRLEGLRLEERMLYPRGAKSKVTVTLPSGQTLAGELVYHDEFTIGMRDAERHYHSWPAGKIKFVIDAPADAHAELLSKYSDADIHNLMAYLQTLR